MSSLLGAAREVAVPGAAVGDRAWPGGWSSAARCRILEPRWVLRNRSRSWGLRRAMPPSAYVLEGLEYCARHSLLLVCQAYVYINTNITYVLSSSTCYLNTVHCLILQN